MAGWETSPEIARVFIVGFTLGQDAQVLGAFLRVTNQVSWWRETVRSGE